MGALVRGTDLEGAAGARGGLLKDEGDVPAPQVLDLPPRLLVCLELGGELDQGHPLLGGEVELTQEVAALEAGEGRGIGGGDHGHAGPFVAGGRWGAARPPLGVQGTVGGDAPGPDGWPVRPWESGGRWAGAGPTTEGRRRGPPGTMVGRRRWPPRVTPPPQDEEAPPAGLYVALRDLAAFALGRAPACGGLRVGARGAGAAGARMALVAVGGLPRLGRRLYAAVIRPWQCWADGSVAICGSEPTPPRSHLCTPNVHAGQEPGCWHGRGWPSF